MPPPRTPPATAASGLHNQDAAGAALQHLFTVNNAFKHMPRSSADRAFGFKAAGLLRILLAADPEELLKALDQLGISVVKPTGIFAAIRALAETFAGPAVDLLDVWRQLTRSIDTVLSDLLSISNLSSAVALQFIRDANEMRAIADAVDNDVRRLQSGQVGFREGIDALEQQTEKDIGVTFL